LFGCDERGVLRDSGTSGPDARWLCLWFWCVSDVVHRCDLWTRHRQTTTVVYDHGPSSSSLTTVENELVGTNLTTEPYAFVDVVTVLLALLQRSFDGFLHFAPLWVFL
jgi:hypothetical protein